MTDKCKCQKISTLHGREGQDYANQHLVLITVDSINWKTLYKCPVTENLWKEYYPHSEEHGGGSPEFIKISKDEANKEFSIKNGSNFPQ